MTTRVFLWLHGGCFGGGSNSSDVRQFLTKHGFRVVTPDFPRSQGLDACLGFLDKVVLQQQPSWIGGVSSGGFLAHALAQRHRLPALLLCPVMNPWQRHNSLITKHRSLQLKFFLDPRTIIASKQLEQDCKEARGTTESKQIRTKQLSLDRQKLFGTSSTTLHPEPLDEVEVLSVGEYQWLAAQEMKRAVDQVQVPPNAIRLIFYATQDDMAPEKEILPVVNDHVQLYPIKAGHELCKNPPFDAMLKALQNCTSIFHHEQI